MKTWRWNWVETSLHYSNNLWLKDLLVVSPLPMRQKTAGLLDFVPAWAGVKRSWAASHPSYQHRRHITMHQTLQFKYRGSDAVLQSHAIICSTSHKIQYLGADSDLICRHPGSARRTEAAASAIVSHFQFWIFPNPVINDFALLYQWICFWHVPRIILSTQYLGSVVMICSFNVAGKSSVIIWEEHKAMTWQKGIKHNAMKRL